jgi:hypothetical protein
LRAPIAFSAAVRSDRSTPWRSSSAASAFAGPQAAERLLELVKVLVDRRDHGLDPAILDTPTAQREADPAA